MRKRLMTIVALIMGLMMVASVAVAQEAAPEAVTEAQLTEELDANGTVLHGRGRLFARGTGHVVLNMGGELRLRLNGNAVITDLAGDAVIVIDDGPESDFAAAGDDSKIVLKDFKGSVYIEGSHFKVNMRGKIAFLAKGKGWAFLQGEGIWRTRNNSGVWSQGGARFSID